MGIPVDMDEIYGKLYNHALTGNADCGGLISYNYISGEPITGLADGRPLFVRSANDKFNLANFMRTHLYASVGVLKIGNDIAVYINAEIIFYGVNNAVIAVITASGIKSLL